MKVDKVADKKFEALKKESFGYEPASERRTVPVVKYLAKEMVNKEEEEIKEEEPEVTSTAVFVGLEDQRVEKQKNVWDNFGKTGEMRTDLAMFHNENKNMPGSKKTKEEGDSLAGQLVIQV